MFTDSEQANYDKGVSEYMLTIARLINMEVKDRMVGNATLSMYMPWEGKKWK